MGEIRMSDNKGPGFFLKIKCGQPKIGISQFIMHAEDMMTLMGRTEKIKNP
jgi:hypothetical protein